MDGFYGEKNVSVKAKKTLSIPKKHFDKLGREVVLLKTIEGYICIYSSEVFKTLDLTGYNEYFLDEPMFVNLSDSGKLNLTNEDYKFLGFENICVIIGVGQGLEVWGAEHYKNYLKENIDNGKLEESSENSKFSSIFNIGVKNAL